MQIVELPPGEKAPAGADRIIIHKQGDDQFRVDGALIASHTAVLFAPPPFSTEKEALADSLKWARKHRIKVLFVEKR
jgi:hypothetical protein